MGNIKVDVNPEVLRWAREKAGYDVEDANLKVKGYEDWEKNGKQIPLGSLKKIAKLFDRQVFVFYFKELPTEKKSPKDFRNLGATEKPSVDLLKILRKSRNLQEITLEIRGRNYWESKYDWMREVREEDSNEITTEKIRQILEYKGVGKKKWDYNELREKIEEHLGILVFQFPIKDTVDGFCFADSPPFTIVVNNKDRHVHRKLFTVCHELAHIVRRQSGVCTCEGDKTGEELECNNFAGEFLLPKKALKNEVKNMDELQKEAKKIGVSREVYLRRLKNERRVPDHDFFDWLEEIRTEAPVNEEKQSFSVLPEIISRTRRGNTCYYTILGGVKNNQLGYVRAADALELPIFRMLNE